MTPTTAQGVLLEPLQIGKLQVVGRVFKSATTETLATADGFVTDGMLEYYEPFAFGQTPLLITGGMYVNQQGKGFKGATGIDADDKIPGLRELTDVVHRHGSLVFAQLLHAGRQMFPKEMGLAHAVSASPVREKGMGTKPRAMTVAEIRQTVEDHAAAAERAQRAGFDGVEILAGVGYLLSAFLTPYTNRRTDDYGGSPANRMRFPLEVVRAVRARVGDDFPVIVKLNAKDALPRGEGLDTPALVEVAAAMEAEGVDAIELTAGHYESGGVAAHGDWDGVFRLMITEGRLASGLPAWRRRVLRVAGPLLERHWNREWPSEQGFLLPHAREFKARLGIPVVCIGGFATAPAMAEAITSGQCDAVAVGRAMIANPFMFRDLREGTSGPVCAFCSGCCARVGAARVTCYHPEVGPQRAAMLAAAGFKA